MIGVTSPSFVVAVVAKPWDYVVDLNAIGDRHFYFSAALRWLLEASFTTSPTPTPQSISISISTSTSTTYANTDTMQAQRRNRGWRQQWWTLVVVLRYHWGYTICRCGQCHELPANTCSKVPPITVHLSWSCTEVEFCWVGHEMCCKSRGSIGW